MDEQNGDVMIAADELTKRYGNFPAIESISFTCRRGEIVGFLGPNGAGKTTTMRILTGYMPPSSGAAYIAGYNTLTESLQARQQLGYLPETVPLYPEMSVEGYLAFAGQLRRVPNLWERIDEVIAAVDLEARAGSYIGQLSKGLRQRVGLAQAMLHDPEVLILDEPTIGLDPRQVVEVRELIKELGQRHTILLSTHILSEVEQLCDRVIMIIDGRIWDDRSMAEFVGSAAGSELRLQLAAPSRDTGRVLSSLVGVTEVTVQPEGFYRVGFDGSDSTRAAIASTAVNASWGLLELTVEKPSLETVFLERLREAEFSQTLAAVEEEE
ncbi:MAG: ATP-binding cassette domain-containing protein [Anaerolineae bacterium]|nr:ATP-binding cassette domain-containing protein [Anaerolineae bacterium]